MPVKEVIKFYLKSINRNSNDDGLWLLYNGNNLNNSKENVKECGIFNGSNIFVYKKHLVTGD